jgi:hypothetical protein
LLGLWSGAVLVFFTLSPFKLPHYALPAFPALALLVGKLWDNVLDRPGEGPSLGWLLGPSLAVFAAFALLSFVAWNGEIALPGGTLSMADLHTRNAESRGLDSPFPSYGELRPLFGSMAVIFLAGSVGLAIALWKRLPRVGLGVLFAALIAFLPLAGEGMALLARLKSLKPITWAITSRAGAQDLIVHEGALEDSGSLVFYAGRFVKIVDGKASNLAFGSTFAEARPVFWGVEELRDQWAGERRIFLVTLSPPDRSVVKELPANRVHEIARSGGRWLYSNRP